MTPNDQSYTATIEVPKAPHHVFECICDTSKWWGGKDLQGSTSRLNDEFTITHGDVHYSKQRVIEVVPDRRIVWLITESRLAWLEGDKHEWTNTRLIFEIAPRGDKSVLRFTHDGLVPEKECYGRCTQEGWRVIVEWLFRFITEGVPHFS